MVLIFHKRRVFTEISQSLSTWARHDGNHGFQNDTQRNKIIGSRPAPRRATLQLLINDRYVQLVEPHYHTTYYHARIKRFTIIENVITIRKLL